MKKIILLSTLGYLILLNCQPASESKIIGIWKVLFLNGRPYNKYFEFRDNGKCSYETNKNELFSTVDENRTYTITNDGKISMDRGDGWTNEYKLYILDNMLYFYWDNGQEVYRCIKE